jgi:hypothetical protein
MIRDGKRNLYRMHAGPESLLPRTIIHADQVQKRVRYWLDGPPVMAWAGDVKLATDKKGL